MVNPLRNNYWWLGFALALAWLSICRSRAADRPVITELAGHHYRLDDSEDLAAYIQALDREIEKSNKDTPAGKAHRKGHKHKSTAVGEVDPQLVQAMELTRGVAAELAKAPSDRRDILLRDLETMSGSVRAASLRVLPPNMTVFDALRKENSIKHPPFGVGREGLASNLADPSKPDASDPVLPSSHWVRPDNLETRDLYYGFGRSELPDLSGVICTYRKPKTSRGVHGGFDVKCKGLGNVKIKFGEEYSQPFAHRIAWALGFHTVPVDCVPEVRVKWDRRILTEFNSRKDETLKVTLFGISVHKHNLQPYLDPFAPISEIVMHDENGKETILRPNPDWSEFKSKLFKNPKRRPETVADNLNEAFEKRISYLVYRNVNVRLREDDEDSDEIALGYWDWNGEGNEELRENRGFAFLSAWISQFDSWAHNNRLYMTEKDGKRTFRHAVVDLGGSLGPAKSAEHMNPQVPNEFPWTFTRPLKSGESGIPLDGTFHNIRMAIPFRDADVHDARWMAQYIARLSGKQILEALVASRMPSAEARLFYNKLVTRRNQAIKDLGLNLPAISLMDSDRDFDYDPQKDGPITITTSRGDKVTAPDGGVVVIKGKLVDRKPGNLASVAR